MILFYILQFLEMIATKKKNEVEKYSSKKLRINEYYDVDQCVATKSIGERVKEGREELCNTVRNPEFYKKQRNNFKNEFKIQDFSYELYFKFSSVFL